MIYSELRKKIFKAEAPHPEERLLSRNDLESLASRPENKFIASSPLKKKIENGWRIQWRNDGFDYLRILQDFKAGKFNLKKLSTGSNFREVYKLETGGRKFVIKRDWELDSRLEKKIWDWLRGTPYHRLIKYTTNAVLKGCRQVQDVFLVAEKMSKNRCIESFLIAEYVEGRSFIEEFKDGRPSKVLDFGPYIPAMNDVLEKIHNYGLASNDIHPGQFILTDNGLKLIDLSLNGPMIICQVNDALTMMHFFGTRPVLGQPLRRLLYEVFFLRRRFKNFYRSFRAK